MRIFNTLTRSKEEFVPLNPGKVKMYVCGPTVYNFFHVGNARTFIIFDTVRRYFEYRGYEVEFIQNFTDIDDKMIKKANEDNTTVKEVGDKYIAEYYQDADGLNIERATCNPRATEFIDDIIEFVSGLIEKGFAYEVNGDVYFRTKKFEGYGKLIKQNLEDLQAGARINVDERKEDPMDFAIWKAQKPGEPAWESPWGPGRPGWHIECSCMAKKLLGETIDIHAGGMDLAFPHHENEIAQSLALHGHRIATYWMHNGFVNIDNQKMSKSLGNVRLAKDFLETYGGSVVRLALLSTHYRAPLNFTDEVMNSNQVEYTKIENAIRLAKVRFQLNNIDYQNADLLEDKLNDFINELADDLNTANAISIIFALVKDLNLDIRRNKLDSSARIVKTLDIMLDVLGFKAIDVVLTEEDIELFNKYHEAKAERFRFI